MNLRNLIQGLQALEARYGGDIRVYEWTDAVGADPYFELKKGPPKMMKLRPADAPDGAELDPFAPDSFKAIVL